MPPKRKQQEKTETAKKTPGKELAVPEKSQLQRDFERITNEMNKGFDRVKDETEANLREIDRTIDFSKLREEVDTAFDMLEQVETDELARIKEKFGDSDEQMLAQQIAFAKAQDDLADTVDDLGRAAWEVRLLAAATNAKLAAVASLME